MSLNNRANSLWQKIKISAFFAIRYIVYIGRKNPLVAIAIIALYSCFIYQIFPRNKVSYQSNLPLPSPSQTATNLNPTVLNSQLPQQSSITDKIKAQELAKLEEEERQINQKRIEASKEKLKKDDVFVGELIYTIKGIPQQAQPIKLEIKAIIDSTYLVKFSDPNNARTSQIFEGELVEQLDSVENSPLYIKESDKYASLILRSRSPKELGDETWKFYKYDTKLVFVPTELGFDGKAEAIKVSQGQYNYNLVLRNDDF